MLERRWTTRGRMLAALLMGVLAAALLSVGVGQVAFGRSLEPAEGLAQSNAGKYVVLAWNDLGMHCYNPDFSDLAILPPYNTIWAQVIKTGDHPQIVTSGVTLEYKVLDNTESASKTNFWSYAQQLFGVTLKPNVGLAGKGLTGTMDLDKDNPDHFVAKGIPLTEYLDNDKKLKNPQPFQLVSIVVRDSTSRAELAKITAVAPVSSELRCDNCHADGADATKAITPTGKVATNILAVHDLRSKDKYPAGKGLLMDNRPVLCAECHSSNALGKPGIAGVPSLSNSMHMQHKGLGDITPDTDGCYNCHPGPKTKCLRDTMSQNFGASCVDCHGTVAKVSTNPAPWLNEPRCDNADCHGAAYKLDQPLYRNSKGHGGLYCESCHDSTHAIAASRESNDSIKFMELQGSPGTLRKCSVCHSTKPAGMFNHGL